MRVPAEAPPPSIRAAPPPPSSPSPDPPPPPRIAELARLSERVVVQLARLGRLDPDAPASPERTQRGLAESVGSNQSGVSKVLRRLVAAEIIAEEKRHVTGGAQRVKIYALTRRGEALARGIARAHRIELLPDGRPAPAARPRRAAAPPEQDSS
jgi:DNA-binding MarR family transcriptional regulator